MIRPEAAAALLRWREAIAGGLAVAAGLWLWTVSYGLPALFGAALVALGAVLLVSGLRHARFRSDSEAPGVVEVDEGRITYMAPVMGGTMALDAVAEVAFRRTRGPEGEGFWRLTDTAGATLFIPEGAVGHDALLDALAPLPGLDGGAMVRALRGRTPGLVVVWRRRGHAALT
ncbi:hypothetical protein [Jannaschia sp. W003]|uniref:hypothetical protein n=1 Tax=Jannaschia sp. W003 TaxID=2867012 RepID=UPI0021A6B31D|nr:hypothetical protein [Jannaschia sp. W003]UWQ22718.1 hypothetical protein K3554_06750 [Jannaschia sp. W003]